MIGRQVRREALLLFFGDLAFFSLALWLTLLVRYGRWPDVWLLRLHFQSFTVIFLVWTLVFFIADLYNRRLSLRRDRLANLVINAQIANSFLAIVLFYFIPYFGITPKITLFVDLLISLGLILSWRLSFSNFLYRRRPERYLFLCVGPEVTELKQALANNGRYYARTVEGPLAPDDWRACGIDVVVLNLYDRRFKLESDFYKSMFAGIRFIGAHQLYEDIFGRIPVAVTDERWLVEHFESGERFTYHFLKRSMDLILSLILLLLSAGFYPLIALAIKLEDGGPIFYIEDRVGRFGRLIKIHKFRSMSLEKKLEDRQVTRCGGFLRRARLDELPQLWSVIIGDQSLIGPRPERPAYVALYEREIPYYHARHLITPGLSGWAQIYQERHPHFAPQAAATREKLSYDLYYVKNRGFWLDLKIVLKTIRILLSRAGR